MKEKLAVILALLMMLSAFAGIGTLAETTDPAFTYFETPVDVHVGLAVSPTDNSLPEGDSADNNQYTRYLKDNFNINIVADWTAASGSDYDQKVALCIASNTMPDGLAVSRIYMLRAAKSGMLYDITNLFDQYASEQMKAVYDSTNGLAMEGASYDGKMVSLVGIPVDDFGVSLMNIRKDWLDMYGLEVPKTLDDIEKVAEVFRDQKPAGENTVAIAGPSKGGKLYSHFLSASSADPGFDPIFSAYDAYPGYWLEGEDGTMTYGTTSENTKAALARLADWYERGLIDPELGTRASYSELIDTGYAGIYFGAWWMNGYGIGDAIRNDPTANWQTYPVYTDDGKWNTHMNSATNSWTIMNKNASEDAVKAMIIMSNVMLRDESKFDTSVDMGWYPIRNIVAPVDECATSYHAMMKVLNGEADPEEYNTVDSPYKLLYNDVSVVKDVIPNYEPGRELAISDFSLDDMGNFMRTYSLLIGSRAYATMQPDKKVYSAVYSMTPTMETKWSNLKKLEDEMVLKVITGKSEIGEFDTFVANWKAQGGDEITAEVLAEVQ